MNIFRNLPTISKHPEAPASEVDEVQAKKDRIAFHQTKVRNGPVKYNYPTNGQLRRAEERRRKRKATVARRRQIRAFFKSEQESAVLRGHLQAVGVLPYSTHYKPTVLQITNSADWIVRRFSPNGAADRPKTEAEITDALTAALNRFQHLNQRPLTTLHGSRL